MDKRLEEKKYQKVINQILQDGPIDEARFKRIFG